VREPTGTALLIPRVQLRCLLRLPSLPVPRDGFAHERPGGRGDRAVGRRARRDERARRSGRDYRSPRGRARVVALQFVRCVRFARHLRSRCHHSAAATHRRPFPSRPQSPSGESRSRRPVAAPRASGCPAFRILASGRGACRCAPPRPPRRRRPPRSARVPAPTECSASRGALRQCVGRVRAQRVGGAHERARGTRDAVPRARQPRPVCGPRHAAGRAQ
jgi:hypothetical protein